MFGREKLAMMVAEFIGTFTLASVILAMLGRTSFPLFAALVAGTAYTGMILTFNTTNRGYFNPALVIAAWTVRQVETMRAAVLITVQMLAGVVAWTANEYLLNTTLKNIANTEFDWRIFAAETIGAFVFVIVLSAAARQGTKDFRYAVTAGIGIVLGMLLASFAGNGLINPAVAVGVQSWSFVYAAAPILGALLGMNLYTLLFVEKTKSKKLVAKARTKAKTVKKKATKKKK